MAIRPERQQAGFALLVAMIFMSVMLAFGLTLSSLAYKQQVLASSAVASQYAFYAADAALECALYADQQQNVFAYPASAPRSAPGMVCDGQAPVSASVLCYNSGQCADKWIVTNRLSFDSDTRCADVTIYKPAAAGVTYLFSKGYDVSCSVVANPGAARFTIRGLQTFYNSSPY